LSVICIDFVKYASLFAQNMRFICGNQNSLVKIVGRSLSQGFAWEQPF